MTRHVTKKIRETGSTDPKHERGRLKHARTEENVTTRPATNTLFNTPDIQKGGLTQMFVTLDYRKRFLAWLFLSVQ